MFRGKLFGKWAGVVSAGAAFAVAVVKITNPALLEAELVMTIMGILLGHTVASDGMTPSSGNGR